MPSYQDLIARMTLEEKCSLLSGRDNFTTKPIPRLGVPSMFLADGPHGLRKQAGPADHLGLNPSLPATCFPTAAALANAWDPDLAEELGAMLGEEAAAQRVSVVLGPGLNLKRSPLGGRGFEYFSEDPCLSGKLAAALIRGIQSRGVAACPKHFAVNSQETLRMHSDSVLDERTLRELYLTGFEIAVAEGRPLALMTSYNKVNGVYANEHPHLLRDILRDEWGFRGLVVTDWGGSNDRLAGLLAGNQLEMPATNGNSDRELAAAVRDGRLPEEVLDRQVEAYLQVLFAAAIDETAPDTYDQEAHHAFARRAAEASMVLLKNEDALLPLAPGARVAVIGDFAQTPRYQGAGSSLVHPTRLDRPLDCLRESGLEVVGYAPGFRRHGGADEALKAEAADLASRAEAVLLFLGLDEPAETEGMDRPGMALRPEQVAVLEAVAAVNPNVAVVFSGGAPVETPWLPLCRALLYGCLGGQAFGSAAARLLTGAAAPSGKLAETWPLALAQTPAARCFPGREATAEYREGLYVGYRYYQTAGIPVRFPFGFGLGYTTFAYSALSVTEQAVTFTLENTGPVPGAETAQVYVSRRGGAVFRPALELKGFVKVPLAPGERRTVTVPLDGRAFRYFNTGTGRFEVEGGTYEIRVGASSADPRLTGQVEVAGTDAPSPYDPALLPSYFSGQVSDVADGEFEALLGRPIPPAHWDRSAPLGLNDTVSQLSYAKNPLARLICRFITRKKVRSEAAGKPDLNILFIRSIPFRGIAKMMGGAVDTAMAESLLEMANGRAFRGLAHLIKAHGRMRRAARDTRRALSEAGKEARP